MVMPVLEHAERPLEYRTLTSLIFESDSSSNFSRSGSASHGMLCAVCACSETCVAVSSNVIENSPESARQNARCTSFTMQLPSSTHPVSSASVGIPPCAAPGRPWCAATGLEKRT
jgi:hypothetical protein